MLVPALCTFWFHGASTTVGSSAVAVFILLWCSTAVSVIKQDRIDICWVGWKIKRDFAGGQQSKEDCISRTGPVRQLRIPKERQRKHYLPSGLMWQLTDCCACDDEEAFRQGKQDHILVHQCQPSKRWRAVGDDASVKPSHSCSV